MIRQEIIDTISERTDIVKLIGARVKLSKRGTRYVGCCPFHKEKTGSFFVFPQTGTFKCFGCGEGGDAIHFLKKSDNLTFVEAVKALARDANIQVEEQEETPQDRQKRLQKEALLEDNERLAQCYRQHFLNSKEARDYAYQRWGKDYCDLISIGYAPKDGNIVKALQLKGDRTLGLINRGGYDFYQDRIIIPIRNRQHQLIGFTARRLDNEQPKYLNSTDSPIFHKDKVLFGIDTAWHPAAKADKCFLVEGGPDCMRLHSIGIYNTVAALGSAWGTQHFQLLKRMASRVCFIPDNDPPKHGETFGHGIKIIFDAGRLAMECGLAVTIKEIPKEDEATKQDADSYFTTLNTFNIVEETDFILWLAEKLFPLTNTTEEQRQTLSRIAYLLSLINDETGVSMYVAKLVKFYPGKKLWMQAVDAERKRREEQETKQRDAAEKELYKKYGFFVEHGCYMSVTEKGNAFEWSNFTMVPLFHIRDNVNPKRLYKIKNVLNWEELVELKQEDLISLAKFKQRIEGLGNFIWKASDKELTKLKSYLYEMTETATEITQMGWQRAGFFAFGNGIFDGDQFIKADEYGIVRLKDKGNFYLPSSSKIYKDDVKLFTFEKQFVHLDVSNMTLEEFSRQLFRVYGDNGRVGFCFYLATLFRDIITSSTSNHWFPILCLFGPKGSGKSEMGHTLLSLFTISYTAPNIQNSTPSALNDTVAASANALAHIDEYKNDLDVKIIEFLKGLWDGTGRTRMNMDLDKKKETTAVDSGIILSGQEMPTADIALFSRVIFLQFPKSEFSTQEKAEYKRLLEMRAKSLTQITLQLLRHRRRFEQAWNTAFYETQKEVSELLGDHKGEDRIMNNWCVPLAALRVLDGIIPTLSYKEMLPVIVAGIQRQNSECKTNGELGNFWNTVQFLANDGTLIEGGDFYVKFISSLKTDTVNANYVSERPVLFLQRTRVFNLYRKEGRQANEKVLPIDALKYYLQNSPAYLGEKVARFDVFKKGVQIYDQTKLQKNGTPTKLTMSQRAYCFDYRKLQSQFSINLSTAADDETPPGATIF